MLMNPSLAQPVTYHGPVPAARGLELKAYPCDCALCVAAPWSEARFVLTGASGVVAEHVHPLSLRPAVERECEGCASC